VFALFQTRQEMELFIVSRTEHFLRFACHCTRTYYQC